MSDRYAYWFSRIRLATAWTRRAMVCLALVTIVSFGVTVSILVTHQKGLVAGIAVIVSGLVLMICYLIIWIGIAAQFHRFLLRRPHWNDWLRLVAWFTLVAAIPVLTATILTIVILVWNQFS